MVFQEGEQAGSEPPSHPNDHHCDSRTLARWQAEERGLRCAVALSPWPRWHDPGAMGWEHLISGCIQGQSQVSLHLLPIFLPIVALGF